jgi:hypothetical protein
MVDLPPSAIVQNKFIEVPQSLSFGDKELLLNLQLKALQQAGYTILAVHIHDDNHFRVEVRPNQMHNDTPL